MSSKRGPGARRAERGRTGERGTRQRFVAAAADLFSERGYAATSMADIIAEAESSAGNLYNYFDGKEALLTDAIGELEHRIVRDAIHPARVSPSDPVQRVLRIIDAFRAGLLSSAYERGSPLGRLAAELGGAGIGHGRLAAAFRRFRAEISECIGHLDGMTAARADDLATIVVALLEGSLLQAQASRSIEPVDVCMRHVALMLRGEAADRPPAG